MDSQNVTLSLPKDLLRQARHIAVDRGMSLSALLAQYIERVVGEQQARAEAALRIRDRLARGFDLGTGGRLGITRESLHER